MYKGSQQLNSSRPINRYFVSNLIVKLTSLTHHEILCWFPECQVVPDPDNFDLYCLNRCLTPIYNYNNYYRLSTSYFYGLDT